MLQVLFQIRGHKVRTELDPYIISDLTLRVESESIFGGKEYKLNYV